MISLFFFSLKEFWFHVKSVQSFVWRKNRTVTLLQVFFRISLAWLYFRSRFPYFESQLQFAFLSMQIKTTRLVPLWPRSYRIFRWLEPFIPVCILFIFSFRTHGITKLLLQVSKLLLPASLPSFDKRRNMKGMHFWSIFFKFTQIKNMAYFFLTKCADPTLQTPRKC